MSAVRHLPKHRAHTVPSNRAISRTFFETHLDASAEAKVRTRVFGVPYVVEQVGDKWAVMPTRPV